MKFTAMFLPGFYEIIIVAALLLFLVLIPVGIVAAVLLTSKRRPREYHAEETDEKDLKQ